MMNPVLEEIIKTGYSVMPDGTRVPWQDTSVSKEDGQMIQRAIRETQAAISLEIGVAHGLATLYICDALVKNERTRHIAIDHSRKHSEVGLHNIQKAGFEKMVDFYELPSHRALPMLEQQGIRIDFAHLDGWHTFEHTLVDFFYVDRMLQPGGIVVIDDVGLPGLRRLCSFILNNYNYSVFDYVAPGFRIGLHKKILNVLMKTLYKIPLLKRYLQPVSNFYGEQLETITLGNSVAFRKEGDYNRHWTDYNEF